MAFIKINTLSTIGGTISYETRIINTNSISYIGPSSNINAYCEVALCNSRFNLDKANADIVFNAIGVKL